MLSHNRQHYLLLFPTIILHSDLAVNIADLEDVFALLATVGRIQRTRVCTIL
jgi:hypothetical protein